MPLIGMRWKSALGELGERTTSETVTDRLSLKSAGADSVGERTVKRFTSDAAQCRKNGWKAGTRLVGDEGYGPTVIEITAVGRERILAVTISHNGEPADYDESDWTLECRKWRRVRA
jgi:hypothetical protein